MKLTIYSSKTYKDLEVLKVVYGYTGINIMYDARVGYVLHAQDAMEQFEKLANFYKNGFSVHCNNGDVMNCMIGWCDENGWEVEVIRCDSGDIAVSHMVDGYLENCPYGWYLPE